VYCVLLLWCCARHIHLRRDEEPISLKCSLPSAASRTVAVRLMEDAKLHWQALPSSKRPSEPASFAPVFAAIVRGLINSEVICSSADALLAAPLTSSG
jgi:hypothetical protein